MTDEPAPTASSSSSEDAPEFAHDGGSALAQDGGSTPKPPEEGVPTAQGAVAGEGAGVGPAPQAPVVETPQAPVFRPNYVFLAVVSIVSLALDLGSKAWAKGRLDDAARPFTERRIEVVKDTFSFMFARNRGGAWGLLQDEPESIRRPFFLAISVVAIAFIVSLYRKLTPQQWALKWGLPLVLGGALGNLINRVQYNYVVDFIDIRAGWIRKLNGMLSENPTDHWPTFNVADIAIVVGVILMAVDMFTPRKPPPLPQLEARSEATLDAAPEAKLEAGAEAAAPVPPAITDAPGDAVPEPGPSFAPGPTATKET
jgi:signal peptidase II